MPDNIKINPVNIGTINTSAVAALTAKELEAGRQKAEKLVVKLLRTQDLLVLELRFKNFALLKDQLVRVAEPALMMVSFQPQSFSEGGGTEDTIGLNAPKLPVNLLSSGKSVLVFKVNKAALNINANDLLDWKGFELMVSDRAIANSISVATPINIGAGVVQDFTRANLQVQKSLSKTFRLALKQGIVFNEQAVQNRLSSGIRVAKPGKVAPPDEWETALEIPRSIVISPTKNARWKHSILLKKDDALLQLPDSLYELWHTRMGVQTKTNSGIDDSDITLEDRLFRVLWAEGVRPDDPQVAIDEGQPGSDNVLVNSPYNNKNRHQLVHETSNFNIPGFVPQPATARKLFLTSLGAYLDSFFETKGQLPNLGLLTWKHLQTLGRTHYVETAQAGFIAPFGHPAVKVSITERKPHAPSLTALNFKRELIIITQPVKYYDRHDGKNNFLHFCFSKIEILTTSTPLLDSVKTKFIESSPLSAKEHFPIKVNGLDFNFKIHAIDVEGHDVSFQMPLVFVSATAAGSNAYINTLEAVFGSAWGPNNVIDLKGQKMALAPKAGMAGTTFPATELAFGVADISDGIKFDNNDEPQHFLPIIRQVKIKEPSYERLTGNTTGFFAKLEDDNNAGGVYASCVTVQPVNFGGNADKVGGVAMPNFTISAFTKSAGAVAGDLTLLKDNIVDAKKYFGSPFSGGGNPTLFGVFQLSDLLDFAGSLPMFTTDELPDTITTTYDLKAGLHDPGLPLVKFEPKGSQFAINTQVIVDKKALAVPIFNTRAGIETPFAISLMGDLFMINFKKLIFEASAGKSADINIDMESPALIFGGPLKFVNQIQKLIPADGFSDPPYLDVTTQGVKCGYSLAIPNLQLGAFTLSNISLGADVNLPFTGGPMTLGFRFCEKQQPFTLTVSLLGGGGYFGFEVDLNGLRQIDAALEFGAAVALNLGVASGAVSIMAGVYFKMTFENGNNTTQLTGYLRINGAMSIIGLITASVELYMAFTYLTAGNKVYGEASVKIKVHVLFFSKSVQVHTSRTFSGDGSDPNFKQTYSPDKWKEYCEAFAA